MPVTIETLTALFGWMSVLNLAMLSASALLLILLQSFASDLHARLFGIPADSIKQTAYLWLGLYKLMIFVFCLAPYFALRIVA